jgi:hypothetical protein
MFQNREMIEEGRALALEKEYCGRAWTAMLYEEVVGCGGVVVPWPGVGIVWTAFSKKVDLYPIWITRTAKYLLKRCIKDFDLHRLEAVVTQGDFNNHRWARSFGFTMEDHGVARRYTADNRDAIRYELLV